MVFRISARPLVAALLALAACQDSTGPSGASPGSPLAARSPQAQDRLEAVFQRISGDVMSQQGAVFVDHDERVGKLVVGVENVGAARGIQNAMARLGVAATDFEVELTSPIEFKATLQNARFTSGVAGMQVHFSQYVCSVGANVDHVSTGQRGFIINSHCTAKQGGVESTLYYQPSKTAFPTAIATEVADPAYVRGLPGCASGKICRYSDASRAVYAAGYPSTRGTIAKTLSVNTGVLTVDEASTFTITAQDNDGALNTVGRVVNKVGRTTGWTRGQITRTCVNTAVSGSKIMQLCQSFVSDPAGATVVNSGDSGSGVWVDNGSGVTLVGLLWGGSSDNKTFIFSPLKQVQQEIGAVNAVR